ncbi:hypothetical protein Esti_002909 [Eimeria stiedai]
MASRATNDVAPGRQGPARGADLALAGVNRHLDLPQQRVAVPRAAAAAGAAEAAAAVRSLVGQTLVKAFFQDMKDVSTHKVGLRNAFDVTLIDKLSAVVRQELIQTADPGTYGEGEGDELDVLGGERVTFTHVSSAIEGASKVYGYRVEAVYDQTYHLLNGLAALKGGGGLAPEAEDEQQHLRRRQRQQQQRLLQFSQGSESTLAELKDITNDQPDMGVVVDPFFVKMAGLFDQAGAQGLLLSNLQVDESLSLRFDGEAPAFPTATAASTAAAAADICPVDPSALADLVLADAPSRPIETSICSEAIAHFTQQIEALRGAADAQPPAGEEGDSSLAAEGDEAGSSQGDEETDELLVGFEPDAADGAAAGRETQQHHQQQQEQQEHSDNEAGMALESVADEFAGHDQDFGGQDRLESLLAGPPEGSGREVLRDLEQLLTSSFLSGEGLGFRRRPLRNPQKRLGAAADEAAAAAATATGKSQQLLAALDPFLIDMTNLNEQMRLYPLLKAERRIPWFGVKGLRLFVQCDMTSSPFATSPQQMLSLSLLASKQLQLSGSSCAKAALVDIATGDAGGAEVEYGDDGEFGVSDETFDMPISTAAATDSFVSRLFDGGGGAGGEPSGLSLMGAPQKVAVSDLRLTLPSRYVDVAVVKRTLRRALHIGTSGDTGKETEEETKKETETDTDTPEHTTTSLLPAVERRNCSPQMLFVCLLYTANDETLFLSPSTSRNTFFVRRKAPLAEQLAGDQLAETALKSVASYLPLDLTQFTREEKENLLPPLLECSPQQQQQHQQQLQTQQPRQQENRKRQREPPLDTPAAAAATAAERPKKGLRKQQRRQQQREREEQHAAAAKNRPRRLRQPLRKRVSSSSSSSSSSSDEEVVT